MLDLVECGFWLSEVEKSLLATDSTVRYPAVAQRLWESDFCGLWVEPYTFWQRRVRACQAVSDRVRSGHRVSPKQRSRRSSDFQLVTSARACSLHPLSEPHGLPLPVLPHRLCVSSESPSPVLGDCPWRNGGGFPLPSTLEQLVGLLGVMQPQLSYQGEYTYAQCLNFGKYTCGNFVAFHIIPVHGYFDTYFWK